MGDEGVHMLRCAEKFLKSDEDKAEVNMISLYRKYNRMVDGYLSIYDYAPDVTLQDFKSLLNPVQLLSLCDKNKPLVLIPGLILNIICYNKHTS